VVEDGFRLVVGGVCGQDQRASFLFGDLPQEGIPQVPGSFLHPRADVQWSGIGPANLAVNSEALSQFLHPDGVGCRFRTAQAVIEVCGDRRQSAAG
jgi:hypothetical protein